MNFKAKSELLVLVLRINVISNIGCRSLCMDFLPPSGGVFRLSLAGSSPGIPCRRSFGFQGSIGVLLVAYHTFKRIFRTLQVRFCVDFILNSLKNRTSCPVRKISIPYPFAAEQEVFVPVLRSFFGFYGQKPEALVPANHWIAFIIAEISLNF